MVSFQPAESVPVVALGTFSDHAQWMGRPAIEQQKREVRRAGLSWGTTRDTVTLSPGTLVTAEALKSFVLASNGLDGPIEGVISGAMARWADEPCFGPPARLYRNINQSTDVGERHRVTFEVPSRILSIPSADAPGGRMLEFPVSDGVLISTHHWSGLLWANLLCLAPVLWRQLMGSSLRLLWRLPCAWLKTWSTDPMVLAGALNRVEAGVRIHPSAVVEGCWLQKGATVGPGAVVRGCVLGPTASIEAQALASFTVLGQGAVLQRRGWIQFGVVHEGAAVGGAMQMGVLGPKASFKHGSYLMDQNRDQSVGVLVDGVRIPAPLGLLGVGVGARSVIGSGVWVAPGRSVGPDQIILASKDKVLVNPEPGLAGAFAVENGRLRRL